MPESVKHGDKLKYVPGEHHQHDHTAKGEPLFTFFHDQPGHPKHDQEVDEHLLREARPTMRGDLAGRPRLFLGMTDQRVRLGPPKEHWPATVVGIWPDGSLKLLIQHPDPGQGQREYDNVQLVDAELEPKPLHSAYKPKE